MDDKHIDRLFRNKLSGMELTPRAEAWNRLESRLSKQPGRGMLYWLRFAAAVVLLGGLGYVAWQLIPSEQQPDDLLLTRISEQSYSQIDVSIPREQVKDTKKPGSESKKHGATGRDKLPSGSVAQVLPPPAEELLAVEASGIGLDYAEHLATELELLTELSAEIQGEPVAILHESQEGTEESLLITVRMVSNGFALAPEKSDLVEGIEGGIGKLSGLIAKVDKGFAELQDVKDSFLSSVTTQKKSKRDSQNK